MLIGEPYGLIYAIEPVAHKAISNAMLYQYAQFSFNRKRCDTAQYQAGNNQANAHLATEPELLFEF